MMDPPDLIHSTAADYEFAFQEINLCVRWDTKKPGGSRKISALLLCFYFGSENTDEDLSHESVG
jgi:hypothetical protein